MSNKMQDAIPLQDVVGNVDRWINDLLTTKARQTTEGLRYGKNAFCCLGRAAMVTPGVECSIEKYSSFHTFYLKGARNLGESTGLLPDSICPLLGLWNAEGSPKTDRGHRKYNSYSLVELNDGVKYSFKQIAERLLLDLRIDAFGYFRPEVRDAWRRHHKFQ